MAQSFWGPFAHKTYILVFHPSKCYAIFSTSVPTRSKTGENATPKNTFLFVWKFIYAETFLWIWLRLLRRFDRARIPLSCISFQVEVWRSLWLSEEKYMKMGLHEAKKVKHTSECRTQTIIIDVMSIGGYLTKWSMKVTFIWSPKTQLCLPLLLYPFCILKSEKVHVTSDRSSGTAFFQRPLLRSFQPINKKAKSELWKKERDEVWLGWILNDKVEQLSFILFFPLPIVRKNTQGHLTSFARFNDSQKTSAGGKRKKNYSYICSRNFKWKDGKIFQWRC